MLRPIEQVINVNDPSILWGDLSPLYRGYQLSNTGVVRSFKFNNKYIFGTLITSKPRHKDIYTLSDECNRRVDVTINELKNIVKRNGGYTIPTIYKINKSRSPILASKSTYMDKRDTIISQQNSLLNEKVSLKLNITGE